MLLDKPFSLPAKAGLKSSYHRFDQPTIDAITTAYALQRPLLVKGEPGLGKSQIAHALATKMDWNLIVQLIHGRTEPTDLLYKTDQVRRLAQAQILRAANVETDTLDRNDPLSALDEANFTQPGPVWWALNATRAKEFIQQHLGQPHSVYAQGQDGEQLDPDKPTVLLLDEIDKADSQLPNALLGVLNNQSFSLSIQDKTITANNKTPPFVVVTSNDDRPLPAAFLRRCVVLTLTLSNDEKGVNELIRIAEAHREGLPSLEPSIVTQAAELTMAQRKNTGPDQYQPGTSEFLDLLYTLQRRQVPQDEQQQVLETIKSYILQK